jgi:hypothetical protein
MQINQPARLFPGNGSVFSDHHHQDLG